MKRIALLLCLCVGWPTVAQERVLSHDVEARVLADGHVDVTERIQIRAEGKAFRQGIVRTLPTRDRDLRGVLVRADIQPRDVLRDGRAEPWRARHTADALHLRTGDSGYLPVPSQPVYLLRYRTTRQVLFGDDHDALSFDAIGRTHDVPVERATVTVILPGAVALDALQAEGETGARGSGERAFHVASSAGGSVRWTTTRPLQPHEGLQVRLAFPKGLVTPPDLRQRITWWTRDHAGLLVALAGLLVLLTYCVLRWRRTRRLQVPGAVPEHFEPPPGFSPAGLRYMRRMRHDARGFAADLLAGAVDEHLCIQRVAQGTRTGWRIERTREGAHALPTMEQRAQLSTLLPAPRDAVDLRSRDSARIAQACKAHGLALRRRFVPTLFRAHAGGIIGGLCIAIAAAVPALMLARHTPVWWPTMLMLVSMLPVLVAFTLLVRVPTLEGRRLLAHAEGLRRHLAGAAKPARHHDGTAPTLDATRYARLLPYAVALEVEDAWTKAFAASVGAPAAVAAVAGFSWYRGLVVTDLTRFSRSIGDSLTARISAAARPKRAAPETPSSAP